ncbi:hypothetical protein L596_007696 [Steinernema carpocapsae]|uniref:Uncharacterized protein n=1 Tax=Steinernema carpocapsae TaxID=34508 RepID=A0A4U5PA56_STECR|nr:hypothetical protein L596_007696 [Steinernema carpocapsae]
MFQIGDVRENSALREDFASKQIDSRSIGGGDGAKGEAAKNNPSNDHRVHVKGRRVERPKKSYKGKKLRGRRRVEGQTTRRMEEEGREENREFGERVFAENKSPLAEIGAGEAVKSALNCYGSQRRSL